MLDYSLGNPKIKEIISTKEFALSEAILDERFNKGLDIYEAAKIVNLSLNEYMDIEYACKTIPIETYQATLEKLKNYKK